MPLFFYCEHLKLLHLKQSCFFQGLLDHILSPISNIYSNAYEFVLHVSVDVATQIQMGGKVYIFKCSV